MKSKTVYSPSILIRLLGGRSVKLRGDGEKLNEKWILKEAMKPFITEEIYKRTKRPFVAPPVALTAEKAAPYKTIIDKHLSKEKVDRLGWAKWSFIEKQRDHFLETADKNSAKVMLIIISYIIIGETFGVATATP
jgi:asparagine synthase (glutamine-hydrolysing)